jgi:hypothetical protein
MTVAQRLPSFSPSAPLFSPAQAAGVPPRSDSPPPLSQTPVPSSLIQHRPTALWKTRLMLCGAALIAAGIVAAAVHGAVIGGLGFSLLGAGLMGFMERRLSIVQTQRIGLLEGIHQTKKALARRLLDPQTDPSALHSLLASAHILKSSAERCAGTTPSAFARWPLHHLGLVSLWALCYVSPAIAAALFALKTLILNGRIWLASDRLVRASQDLSGLDARQPIEGAARLEALLWLSRLPSEAPGVELMQRALGGTREQSARLARALESPRASSSRMRMQELVEQRSLASAVLVKGHDALMADHGAPSGRAQVYARMHAALGDIQSSSEPTRAVSRLGTPLLRMIRAAESQDHGFSARCSTLLREVLTAEAMELYSESLLGQHGVEEESFKELLAMHTLLERAVREDPALSGLWAERGIPERLAQVESTLLERLGWTRGVMLQRLTAAHVGDGLAQGSCFVNGLPVSYRRELESWISDHQPDHPISLWIREVWSERLGSEQQLVALSEQPEGLASAFQRYFGVSSSSKAFVREVAQLGCRGRQSRLSTASVAGLLAAGDEPTRGPAVGVERLMRSIQGHLKQMLAQLLQKGAEALHHRDRAAIRSFPTEALQHMLALMQGQRPVTARFSNHSGRELLAFVQTAFDASLEPAAMALQVQEMMADPEHRGLLAELQEQMRRQAMEQPDCPLRVSVYREVEQALRAAQTESFRWRRPSTLLLRAEQESIHAQLQGAGSDAHEGSPGRAQQMAALVTRLEDLTTELSKTEKGRAEVQRWMPEADKSRRHELQNFLDAAECPFMERGLTSPWTLLRQLEQEGRPLELHELCCKLSAWLHGVPLPSEVMRMLSDSSVTMQLEALFQRWFDGPNPSLRGALAILEYAGLVCAADTSLGREALSR